MADKTLNTRIRLKYDTLANWTSNNPVLLAGELAIVEVPNNVDPIHNAPAILMKVGDGTSTFTELSWSSALAADVYSWAKAAVKPTYTAAEVGAEAEGTAQGLINALDKTDSAVEGQYVSAVSQKDGVITVTRASLPTGVTYTFAEGTTDGAFVVTPSNGSAQTVNIHGLGTAAYADTTAFEAAGAVATHNTSPTAHNDIRQEITALAEKVSGRATAYVFQNKSDPDYTAAIGKAGSFVVGDTIYFLDTDVADEWVTAVNDASPYYTFQELETEHPDLNGYVTGTGLTADKIVLGNAGSEVKASAYGITTTLTAGDNANVVTGKAVADYVAGLDYITADDVPTTTFAAGDGLSVTGTDGGTVTYSFDDTSTFILNCGTSAL